jgi:hypothetical protein
LPSDHMPVSLVVSSASDVSRIRVAPGESPATSIVLQVPRNDEANDVNYFITISWNTYDGFKDFFTQISDGPPLVAKARERDVTIDLGNVTTTSVSVDNSVRSVADGKLNLSIEPGNHTFVLPETVDMGSGIRAVFRRFLRLPASATVQPSKPNRFSLYVTDDVNLIAVYDIQYYVTIVNDKGASTGAGWYDSGSVARFSISPTTGLLITGDFDHWEGDFSGSSSSGSFVMDQPRKLSAVWHTGYWELYAVSAVIVAVIVAVAFLVRRSRRA